MDAATATVWIIGRTELKGAADLDNVKKLQVQYSLTSLREWQKGNRNTTGDNPCESWLAYDVSNSMNWFAVLNEGLRRNPPQGADLAMLGLFESLMPVPSTGFLLPCYESRT